MGKYQGCSLSIWGLRERLFSVHSHSTIKEEAMNYLCLVYLEEKKLNALSERESEGLNEESLALR
jgi:hypothetical protein